MKLGARFRKEDGGPKYGPYVLGRVWKVYLPYAAAVVVYYAVLAQIHYVTPSWKGFFSYLWLGNLSSQFYYIVITMQFYLLMPMYLEISSLVITFIHYQLNWKFLIFEYFLFIKRQIPCHW